MRVRGSKVKTKSAIENVAISEGGKKGEEEEAE